MQSLSWYKNRLRRMSLPEVGYRSAKLVRGVVDRIRPAGKVPAPETVTEASFRPWIAAPPGLDARPYREAADRIMRGTYTVFDLEAAELGQPPDWNRDPLTGTHAPLRHATLLDYRDEAVVGNIKYLWEPNRHLHLVTLAQAWTLSSDPRYADALRAQLESWIEQCPYPLGANWTSALELGIRLINWSICWQLIGGQESALFSGERGQRFRDAWLRAVYLHARHIMRNLSRFSSANNHLIGEAAGVFVAAMTWPCWPQMNTWRDRARHILIEEASTQNAPDGVNREQAVSYQQFVADFLLLSALAGRAGGVDFPPDYWGRLERMIDAVASMTDIGGHVPMIGDADDGYVVCLSPDPGFCPYRSLIATGAVLFDRADLASKAGIYDAKSAWLLASEDGMARFDELRVKGAVYVPRRAFPETGYYLLGSGFESREEVRLMVDAGPLGYLSIAAHGHADALSIVLSVGGREVLVDPGTYCYHTEPEWRRYFRGTSAHNTVGVDGVDQSVQSGNFMWSDHASSSCEVFRPDEVPQRFVGVHDGYRRLSDALGHRREIRYEPDRLEFEIVDSIECQGPHEVTRFWHFAEDLVPKVDHAGECRIDIGSNVVTLAPGETVSGTELLHGSVTPPGGWVSRRFGRKAPSYSLRWTNAVTGATVLKTVITCRFDVKDNQG